MNTRIFSACSVLSVVMCLTVSAFARNVDLSTVPSRNTVQLTIYNSEDLTLVRETRVVSFKKGNNPLQFSWANTLIDPTSVELRFPQKGDQLTLSDTTYPHDKPQMLYWNVDSQVDGEATVEITYFTSGITWSADYLCIANPAESDMGFEGFVRVTNHSGEDYENAQVRLVVGTINLVEKIAQLARVPMQEVGGMLLESKRALRRDAAKMAFDAVPAPAAAPMEWAAREKEIIKEGLSEYFIYTIDGTETIPTGWSKRMRSFEGQTVPFKIQYRYRPMEYGDQLVRMYLLTNDKPSKLGETPLPDGVVRLFRRDDRGSLAYLTQQTVKYIPIGDKIELNLGPDPEVVFELVPTRVFRDNIWMRLQGGNVFKRADEPGVEVEVNSSVVGWDEHAVFVQRIRNYTPKAIEVEVRRTLPGHVVFKSNLNPVLHDFQTVQYTTTVGAGEKAAPPYEVVTSQGRNSKQSNVTLQQAQVTP